MKPLLRKLNDLQQTLDQALKKLDLPSKNQQLIQLENQIAQPDFWHDQQNAEKISKKATDLRKFIEKWQKIQSDIFSSIELAKIAVDLNSEKEVEVLAQQVEQDLTAALQDIRMSGDYDNYPAIMEISAGVGGTDAQDWAQLLQQMYIKYANSNNMVVEQLNTSYGETAGIKSTTLRISGLFAYGKLKSEKGVHRLVRLSPFNSDNLRQTSFAMVDVIPEIDDQKLNIDEKDLRVDVFRSGGRGGQSVNTTDSAVRITHIPTGIVVTIQNERSQLKNKQAAKTILFARLSELAREQKLKNISQLRGKVKSADWGSQIRSYILHPYTKVKDHRTNFETSDTDAVLNGKIEQFIDAYLQKNIDQ